jgi:hypothetical protein
VLLNGDQDSRQDDDRHGRGHDQGARPAGVGWERLAHLDRR